MKHVEKCVYKKMIFVPQLIIVLSVLSFWSGNSSAATYTVTSTADGGAGSLREALTTLVSSNDTVNFNLGGSGPWLINLNTSEISVKAGVTGVQVTGVPATPNLITVVGDKVVNAGDTTHSVFHIPSNSSVSFSGITVTWAGGNYGAFHIEGEAIVSDLIISNSDTRGVYLAPNASFSATDTDITGNTTATNLQQGAGIYAVDAEISLTNCLIDNNSESFGFADNGGGGLYLRTDSRTDAVTITITDTVVSNNSSFGTGGGIYWQDNGGNWLLDLQNVTLDNNETGSGANQFGGGIFSQTGRIKLTGCTIINNTAGEAGGGIHAKYLTLKDSIVRNNSASYGGGILAPAGIISGCEISGNTANNGAGMYSRPSSTYDLTIENSTFSGNIAEFSGGGLIISADNTTHTYINYCTFTDNIADNNKNGTGDGGGIYQSTEYYDPGAQIHLRGTIVADNVNLLPGILGSIADDCYGTFDSNGYNLIGYKSGQTGFVDNTKNDKVGTLTQLDPMLGPLADNGGPTWTHALLEDSPALSAAELSPTLTVDQRGEPRPCGYNTDMGAYESCSQNGTLPNPDQDPNKSFPWTMFLPAITNKAQL